MIVVILQAVIVLLNNLLSLIIMFMVDYSWVAQSTNF